jgi:uncharacterized protein (DUF1786 family)
MENNYKLVVPSPTMIIRQRVRQATRRKEAILLTGVIMGGGPSAWAIEDHLKAGLVVYATPEAAKTINDDLAAVEKVGVKVVSEDEAKSLPNSIKRILMRDFDFPSIQNAFQTFGTSIKNLDVLAVGVFDHGNAPPNISDRKFRFDYLDERIRKLNQLSAFAYAARDVPYSMTRLQCVVDSARKADCPVVVMDTAPAAVLGATLDPQVSAREQVIIANIGNFHTLAFRLGEKGIEGLFEHHTGFLNWGKLEGLLRALGNGSIRGKDVFDDQGHGALMYDPTAMAFGEGGFDVVITGPRRNLFPLVYGQDEATYLRPYYAAPFGDMMITGCFGILAAVADLMPELAEPIRNSLKSGTRSGSAPWEVE